MEKRQNDKELDKLMDSILNIAWEQTMKVIKKEFGVAKIEFDKKLSDKKLKSAKSAIGYIITSGRLNYKELINKHHE
jgi:hypothetical protein